MKVTKLTQKETLENSEEPRQTDTFNHEHFGTSSTVNMVSALVN